MDPGLSYPSLTAFVDYLALALGAIKTANPQVLPIEQLQLAVKAQTLSSPL